MQKLKVLAISHNMSVSGCPIGLFNVMNELKNRFDVTVASPFEGPMIDHFVNAGIGIRIVPDMRESPAPAVKLMEDYDVLFANTLLCIYSVLGVAEAGKPVVWSIHETSEYQQKLFECRELAHAAFNAAGDVLVECEYSRNLYQQFRKKPLTVCPIGVEIRPTIPDIQRSDKFKVLMIGSITPQKGKDVALKAAGVLNDPNVEFNFVGQRVIEREETRLYDDNLRFIKTGDTKIVNHSYCNFVTDRERKRLMDETDVVIIPSREDLTNLVTLEAMEAGKMVIASDVGGLGEIIRASHGMLFPVANPGGLALCIKEAVKERDMTRRVGLEGREYVKKNHSLASWASNIAENIRRVYNAIRVKIPSSVHVCEASSDGEGVGGQNAVDQVPAGACG